MAGYGKPNATGRSSGKRTGRAAKIHGPPKGEPFVWLTRELLSSPAWRARSITCVRLLDFLMVEHMNHGSIENGNLKAPYDQLVAWGLTRNKIRAATDEAEFLGLLRFERGGRWALTNLPSTYRLTFQADREDNEPTNDWKRKTAKAISAWKQDRAEQTRRRGERRQKQIGSITCATTVVPLVRLRDGNSEGGRE